MMAKLLTCKSFAPAAGSARWGPARRPKSPVCLGHFINGAGPGSHGIFDFIHRHPDKQCEPFYSAAETLPGHGGLNVGEHKIPLEFWPFNHKAPSTVLNRKGTPFWNISTQKRFPRPFYDLPSNYPLAHRGMGITAASAEWNSPIC